LEGPLELRTMFVKDHTFIGRLNLQASLLIIVLATSELKPLGEEFKSL
jgi:hypothetical protein